MNTDLSCSVLCPFDNFWAGFVQVRFAWGRCGGPLIRGSDDPNETVLGRGPHVLRKQDGRDPSDIVGICPTRVIIQPCPARWK